jgi:hypothetical protein
MSGTRNPTFGKNLNGPELFIYTVANFQTAVRNVKSDDTTFIKIIKKTADAHMNSSVCVCGGGGVSSENHIASFLTIVKIHIISIVGVNNVLMV